MNMDKIKVYYYDNWNKIHYLKSIDENNRDIIIAYNKKLNKKVAFFYDDDYSDVAYRLSKKRMDLIKELVNKYDSETKDYTIRFTTIMGDGAGHYHPMAEVDIRARTLEEAVKIARNGTIEVQHNCSNCAYTSLKENKFIGINTGDNE